MKKIKQIKIGILGLGVVGSELVRQIRNNHAHILKEYALDIKIKGVFVKDLTKKRAIDTSDLHLTQNAYDLIDDPDISVLCECIGGNGFANTGQYIIKSLQNKKQVIMSSKKALAHFAEPFLTEAKNSGVSLKYDATVGGGIPIAKVIENAFRGDTITEIKGILNATSNFIYSQMSEFGLSYNEALAIAQSKGYAENDPTEDVEGIDAKNKLVILSLFAAKKYIHPDTIHPVSFTRISKAEIESAKLNGLVIKPVASIKFTDHSFQINVGPCLVPADNILACTPSNYNTIILKGKNCGELAFYGQGAGASPTASAMFDDLINCCQTENSGPVSIKNPDYAEQVA